MTQSILEQYTVIQLINKFPAYFTRYFSWSKNSSFNNFYARCL